MGIGSRSFLGLLWGAIGGGVGWLLTDFWANPLSDPERMLHDLSPGRYWLWGALIGACISGALAVADTIASGSRKHLVRSVLGSAILGFIGGGTGLYLGGVMFRVLGGQSGAQHLDFLAYMGNCILRAIGWTLAGVLLGAGYGLSQRSFAKVRNGAIGGILGGFIGGLVFSPLSSTLPIMLPFIGQSDRVARLVTLCLIGSLIGFFTALVGALLKSAWVLVVYARNEGREIILERPVSHIGRSEMAEIPVFKDRLLAANHAEIRLLNGRYSLVDGGSVVGSSVNGQKVTEPVLLKDSDLIQIGNTQIVFYERATAGSVRRQVDLTKAAPAAPAIVKEGTCPFCGQVKDPATGECACSVPPSASAAPLGTIPGGGMMPESSGWSPASGPAPLRVQDVGLSPSSMRLVATVGPHAGETFFLTGMQLDAGRDAANTIPLVRDTTVSRKHATLRQEGGSWTLTDEGSSNGTFVNGVRIASQTLHPGDEVTLGTARFRVDG